jgi:hypothetical protein
MADPGNYKPCGCMAHLNKNDPRASIWRYALGCLEFPLKHPISHVASAEGEYPAKYLEGDWAALTNKQKNSMCKKLFKKFGVTRDQILTQIKALDYMPIKDENITVVICKKHSMMMM